VLGNLLRICRRERVAIWHAHDYKSNLIGLLLRPFWPMRLVTTVHGWVERTRRTPLYYAVDRFSLPRYERVICVSQDLHERCRRLGVPADRCLLIENGIDVDQFVRRTPAAAARQRLGLSPDRLIIGAVGRLSHEKGFDLLIRAADRLLGQGLDVELIIAGDGAQRPELEALITALGRHDRIRLTGYCSDTLALYEALDVFALSSLREGLPNVLLEAMALEVPVVATRVAGVPSLVRHEENGLLTGPGSVEGLVDSLARLLRDGGLRERLGRAGRATVAAEFSFEVRMRKIVDVLDGLLAREPSPPPLVTELTS
jgi:glycosyltransferase involved in cell wall biosynthesis